MKKAFLPVIAVMAVICAYTAPSIAEEEIGDYATVAHIPANAALLPPGHFGIVASYLERYLSAGPMRFQWADKLTDGVDNPNLADEITDFYIVDVRTAKEYCAGHIEGSVNVPLGTVAGAENLASYPTDKPILLVCNTGHQAMAASMSLGALGFDVYMLRFGLASWKAVSPVNVWSTSVKQNITGIIRTNGDGEIVAGLPLKTCP